MHFERRYIATCSQVNVGEMGFPVGAAVKTRRVIVGEGEVLCKADHDFSKFNLIPSVNLVIKIPESLEDSFYEGDTTVMIKCAITQPSSACRHVAESAFSLPQASEHCPVHPTNTCIEMDSFHVAVLFKLSTSTLASPVHCFSQIQFGLSTTMAVVTEMTAMDQLFSLTLPSSSQMTWTTWCRCDAYLINHTRTPLSMSWLP